MSLYFKCVPDAHVALFQQLRHDRFTIMCVPGDGDCLIYTIIEVVKASYPNHKALFGALRSPSAFRQYLKWRAPVLLLSDPKCPKTGGMEWLASDAFNPEKQQYLPAEALYVAYDLLKIPIILISHSRPADPVYTDEDDEVKQQQMQRLRRRQERQAKEKERQQQQQQVQQHPALQQDEEDSDGELLPGREHYQDSPPSVWMYGPEDLGGVPFAPLAACLWIVQRGEHFYPATRDTSTNMEILGMTQAGPCLLKLHVTGAWPQDALTG